MFIVIIIIFASAGYLLLLDYGVSSAFDEAFRYNLFSSDSVYGGEEKLKSIDSFFLKSVNDIKKTSLVSDVHYYYCIVSPKLLDKFKRLCDENNSVYEILPEFKHLRLWKRSGIVVDIQFTPETSDYIEQLVDIWNATPFYEVEISITLKTGDFFITKEKIMEFKKGYDMVKYACTIAQPGSNCTLFKGVCLIFPDIYDGLKKLDDPQLVITMKAVHKLTREKTLMFYKEFNFSGTAKIN